MDTRLRCPYDSLRERRRCGPWLQTLCDLGEERLAAQQHGDLPGWLAALAALPPTSCHAQFDQAAPALGPAVHDPAALRRSLMKFHPWRKGPLQLGGVMIDTEWCSDWKWNRVAPHIRLNGHRVLDIGCGNGYFGLRMLGAGAALVTGIDPTMVFVMQWLACRHFSGEIANYVLPLGVEDLPDILDAFDTVFSMGVLYHRRDPLHHLQRIHTLLAPGGRMVLETLVLPQGRENELLLPGGRYARMRNVRAIPGTGRLMGWIDQAGFAGASVVDVTPTTIEEQRSTQWMKFESLDKALDPSDPDRTIETHPAPIRAVVIAEA